MTVRLLCIANPSAYEGATTDIPLSYARLAAHPDIELYHADTSSMTDRTTGTIAAVEIPDGFEPNAFFALERAPTVSLRTDDLDVAFCRTLKPFFPGYLRALQRHTPGLLFVNDPAGIERQIQPGFMLDAAADWMPPALIPSSASDTLAFLREHGTIVAKRANSCGGRGVYRISNDGALLAENVLAGSQRFENVESLHEMLSASGSVAFLLMQYLSGVVRGERRVIAVDGEVYGGYVRRSTTGHWVQNLPMGASPAPTEVSADEHTLVSATSAAYKAHGIHVLGYDLLQDSDRSWRVSEINAGNIGGLFRLEDLGVEGVRDRFVDWLHRFAKRRACSTQSPGST